MEQDNKNGTEHSSTILKDALRKLISMPAEEIKTAVIKAGIQMFESGGLQAANEDSSWSYRRETFNAQAEITRSFWMGLGLEQRVLQPLMDVAIAIKDADSKDSRLLMSENAADKLRLSKSWSANASLFDRALKTAVIVTAKVLQRKNISRDHAHRLLAAVIKAAGQKGTDRSIAKWEKEHDDAIIADRKRAQKKVHSAYRIRAITTAQIGELPVEHLNEHMRKLLNITLSATWAFQENSLFVDAEINDALAAMSDFSVDTVMQAFDYHLNSLNVCYKTGAKPRGSEVDAIVPMASQIIQRRDEVRRENLMFLCAQPLFDPETGDSARHDRNQTPDVQCTFQA